MAGAGAYLIVVGNEKGGSGKTTTTMHVVIALLRMGFRVGTIDIDGRQKSLSRYMENRWRMIAETKRKLGVSEHRVIVRSKLADPAAAAADEQQRLTAALEEFSARQDFIVVDCPGSENPLVRLAHTFADTVITPINDSMMDIDLIVELDSRGEVRAPGIYAEMVWEQRQERLKTHGSGLDWVVMRNRLTQIGDSNKRMIADRLDGVSKLLGFRLAVGLSERVIYRQLFLAGLTILDLQDPDLAVKETPSHLAARQEVKDLIRALRLPKLDSRLERL
ncbi:MAG: AAA family ATPase [Alphaproteobacteria bacterium]|nr:AAA family ATPase [Alphaproteobacteria bacterium]MBF0129377.1 AAA family ATPase [Alphaproteobacteria bacterium]